VTFQTDYRYTGHETKAKYVVREFVVEHFALERAVEMELALLQELTDGRNA
jgi:hypothetical protein